MSISAWIDINFTTKKSISSTQIIEKFTQNNWRIVANNKIHYLPLGDKDVFNWQKDTISESDFFEIVRKKEQENEIIGITMTWATSQIGIDLLIYNNYQLNIGLNTNRQHLNIRNLKVTDINWYLEKILAIFDNYHMLLTHLSFTQD